MKFPVLLLFFMVSFCFAQHGSKEDFHFLERTEDIKINLKKGDFKIVKSIHEKAEYLTANKLYFANEILRFDSFTELKDIEATTYLPATGKTIEVDYIETKHEFDDGIFYSDQQTKNFTFPAVTKGAITDLKYKEVITEPHFLGLFRFGTYAPTKKAVLRIEFPKNVEIGYREFHTENINVSFHKEETKNSTIYTWTTENVAKFSSEENAEAALYHLPHIILHIKNYTEKGKTIPILNNVDDLYSWYASLAKQVDENDLQKVYKIAEDIAKAHTTDREKAEAIYNWVQENITYVAFEDGLGGFIPRGAASVCNNRYGDCKDMANLLYVMLNHVGIPSFRTWIGTRDRPYLYDEVPTPMVDNHMITATVIDNDTIFIDGTDSYVNFGMPSSFTQTKEALIGISPEKFVLKKVPVQPSEKSKTIINTNITFKNGNINASEERVLTGYERVDFVTDYLYKKKDNTEEEFLNTTLALGNNKTKYQNIKVSPVASKHKTLTVSFDLLIESYAKTIGSKTILNLNIDRTLSKQKIDIAKRKYAKKIDHQFQKEYTTTFVIPEGYKVTSVPKPIKYDGKAYGFSISYEEKEGKIIQHKNIYINTLRIEKQDFEDWNSFVKKLIKAYKKSIIIEK
ncbi:transglutaminase-like enzyme; cysteine protease [Kordia algicida OT-1]|uniref:Transglutaminase-like enzyme cysteine protease n=2 Tax=Kordia TaxID=221065 RepID=A9DV56_9FLAO|nr:transglutaminase-like enzyme; cysteine protease [Kordia algicida OT-1]